MPIWTKNSESHRLFAIATSLAKKKTVTDEEEEEEEEEEAEENEEDSVADRPIEVDATARHDWHRWMNRHERNGSARSTGRTELDRANP